MAGKRIESIEIVQDDITKNLRDSINKTESKANQLVSTLGLINTMLVEMKKNASTIKEGIFSLGKTNSSDLNARSRAHSESNKLSKDAILLEREKAKLQKDLLDIEAKRLRNQKLRNQESKKELSAYQQESKALNEIRLRYKDLLVLKEKGIKLTKEEEKELRKLRVQVKENDAMLKKVDASTGQFQRNVGNYPKVLGSARTALQQLGLAFGGFQIASFTKKTIVDFEENAANMAKTLDTTVGKAKEISRSLNEIDTRTSIEDLQGIATIGGQLGETTNTIIGFTESIDKLNVALGDEFTGGAEEITTVLGGLRNVLSDIKTKDSAKDLLSIGNALNVLGAEGTATSPIISDFAGRISGIGIPLGLTSDEVLGLSATLQELNINAERGGTAVGAILQRITRDTKGFSKLAGMPVKEFEELLNKDLLGAVKLVAKGFSTLQGDSVKQSKVLEQLQLTGSGASEVFLKLGGNIDLLEKRVTTAGEALKNTDSITKEFEVKNNTLGATLDKISKEFQKYVIGLDESGKVTGGFSIGLQFLVSNMQDILKIVAKGIKAWIAYKAVMKTLQVRDAYRDWKSLEGGIKGVSDALKDGKTSAQAFGQALKGIGLTGIIMLFSEVYSEIMKVASSALVLEQRMKAIAELQKSGTDTGIKLSEKYNNSLKERLKIIELQKARGEITEKQANEFTLKAIDNNKTLIKQRIEELKLKHRDLDESRKIASLDLKYFEKYNPNIALLAGNKAKRDEYIRLTQNVKNLTAAEQGYLSMIIALQGSLNALSNETSGLVIEQAELNVTTDNQTKKTKELNTVLDEQNRYLSEQIRLTDELNNLNRSNEIDSVQNKADEELQKQIDSALKTGSFDNFLTDYKEFIRVRTDISIQGTKAEEQFRIEELQRGIDEAQRIELENITKNRDQLLAQEGLTSNQILFINQQYEDQLRKLEEDRISRQNDLEMEKIIIHDETTKKQTEITKQGEQDIIDAKQKTLDAQKEFFDELGTATSESLERNFDEQRKWIEISTKFLEDQIDKRIALLNKESEAHKEQQDYLKGLADSGNINKEQSIAQEAELQRQAEVEKLRLERQKQFIQSLSAFMTDYYNLLEEKNSDGSAKYTNIQALGKALLGKEAVEKYLQAIPAFAEGGTHLGGPMLVNDAPGASFREIIETPDGKIFSPKGRNVIMNAPAGTEIHTQDQWDELNNSMRTKDAMRYSNSLGGNKAGNSFDIGPLLKKFDRLEKAIENIPEVDYKVEETLGALLTVLRTEKRNGNTTRTKSIYRFK